jgi:ectoine hydroxylase-related dioxygenase (phytanoyl-CoA dioxygenase family)
LVDWNTFKKCGYAIVPGVCAGDTMDTLIRELDAEAGIPERRGGARLLLSRLPALRHAAGGFLMDAATALLQSPCFPVRAIYFDKTPEANWNVTWHQDVTIAVDARRDTSGFGPWTEKNGVVHVQPPVEVLEGMVAVRLHLDECGDEHGPLRVIPGSHAAGRLVPSDIMGWRGRVAEVVCTVRRGDVLAMRPLLLHASSSAKAPAHRRVLHVEYAIADLPNGLQWLERCA